ncbi:MAG: PEP-CTERM sorting domain-containing protein [Phycisphaeraceae bacterium]|nr:PEP-CTERM sorting domain-containing protein [Phycisphaeraceae bacterium]MCW5754488.1 PEP-CTERM sorting domain-containing protein [Phycisphaeraceae bacterium]
MKKFAIVAVAGLAALAGAQHSITYQLAGVNMTDAGRGTANAEAGDMIRIVMSAQHTGLSLGLAKFDLTFTASGGGVVTPAQVVLTETPDANNNFQLDLNETGRHPHMRQATSDKPTAGGVGAALIVATQTGPDVVTLGDTGNGGIDLGTFPPTFNPLIPIFPIASGAAFFIFDFVYQGGTIEVATVVRGAGRVYRDAADGNGASVSAPGAGESLIITPAPASLALLGLGGLAAARRRRA